MRDTNSALHRDAMQLNARTGSLLVATRAVLAGMVETLLRWQELSRQRRRLLELDVHMLKDIGISRADAVREAKRPFWDQRVYKVGDRQPGSPAESTGAPTLACCQR